MTIELTGTPNGPDLTGFLLARITEDEALASETDLDPGWEDWLLRESAAKRAVARLHALTPHPVSSRINCSTCGARTGRGCLTLRHLAAVYADHPDYRGEWKP